MTDRYPVDPLVGVLGARSGRAALERLGVTGSTASDYLRRGVTERVADRLAVAAGYHPANLWPGIDAAGIDRECAAPDCTTRFVPIHQGPARIYCTKTCKARVLMRRMRDRRTTRAAR